MWSNFLYYLLETTVRTVFSGDQCAHGTHCSPVFLEDMTLHLNIIYLKIQLFSYGEKNTCVDITFAYIGIRKVGGEPSNFFSKYKLNAIKALKLKVVELDPTYIPLSICFQ